MGMKEKADGHGPHDGLYIERVPRAERWSFPSRGAVRSPDPRCFFPTRDRGAVVFLCVVRCTRAIGCEYESLRVYMFNSCWKPKVQYW